MGMEQFSNMAWETFKVLVWPAKMSASPNLSKRGEPDTDRLITDMEGPRVFETYKSDWETFQKGAAKPLDWHLFPSEVSSDLCADAEKVNPLPDGTLILTALHKFGNLDLRIEDAAGERSEILAHLPIMHVVVGQNRKLVRYQTGFNRTAFNTISAHGLYKPSSLKNSDDAPEGGRRFDYGSITIKSAWIDMTNIPNPEVFHKRYAWVQKAGVDLEPRTCDWLLVGLVGLHIAHKTRSSPQWIWASFEHVRNAPYRKQPRSGAYTFHDGSSAEMEKNPPTDARLPQDPSQEFKSPSPYNIERWKLIPRGAKPVNDAWRAMLAKPEINSVWANYELVAVQWPKHKDEPELTGAGIPNGKKMPAFPVPPCADEFDANLANTVIETFLQKKTVCEEKLTCMSCHNETRNYDFVWSIPLNKGDPASKVRKEALSTLYEITGSWTQR